MTTTATTPKGVILRDAEVRELIETGTVRIVRKIKEQPKMVQFVGFVEPMPWMPVGGIHKDKWLIPFPAPGDTFWVRETFRPITDYIGFSNKPEQALIMWKDGKQDWLEIPKGSRLKADDLLITRIDGQSSKWCSAATMPRWAARLHGRVVSRSVEQIDGAWCWVMTAERSEG